MSVPYLCRRQSGITGTVIGFRVRDVGPYKEYEKLTLILAVSSNGFIHVRLADDAGTTTEIFKGFLTTLIDRLEGMEQREEWVGPKVFIWDNLAAHKSDVISNLLLIKNRLSVPRAPYWPVDGPIEYVFHLLEQQGRLRLYRIHTMYDLSRNIHEVITEFTPQTIENCFIHCGYLTN